MRKTLAILLASLTVCSLAACSSGTNKSDTTTTTTAAQTTQSKETTANDSGNAGNSTTSNPVLDVFHAATSSATGAYATIKVSADVKMDDTTAWLGLCPSGKDYITEIEADEVDVIFFYADDREEGDPYVFACDFESVEDGTYAVIVATSDDENVGYVVIQLEMTKSGDKVSFDFANAKLKERPAK